jgi:hypothetical protein
VVGALAQALLPILLQQLGRTDGVEHGLNRHRVSARAALDTLGVLVERARLEADAVLGRDLGSQLIARGPLGDFLGEPETVDARAAWVLSAIDEQRNFAHLSGVVVGRDIITSLPGSPSNLTRFRAGVSNTRVFPHSAICQLRMQMSEGDGAWFIGTGFYVGAGLILTAGHNVFHARYGRATRMIVTPGRQSLMVRPFTGFEITPSQMHAHPEWTARPTRAVLRSPQVDEAARLLTDEVVASPSERAKLQTLFDEAPTKAPLTDQLVAPRNGAPKQQPFARYDETPTLAF